MSHEILKTKNEISMVLRGRKSIAPIFFPFLTLGCGQPNSNPSTESLLRFCSNKDKLNCGMKNIIKVCFDLFFCFI